MNISRKIFTNLFQKVVGIFCIAILFSCGKDQVHEDNAFDELQYSAKEKTGVKADQNAVVVTSTHMNLELPSEISSGWNTFQFKNESHNTHFFIFSKLPEGKTVEDSKAEVVPPFQEGMNWIVKGDLDAALAAFGELPAWSQEIVYTGGVGLLSPGQTGKSTVYLEPGNYAVECYIKNDENVFHTTMGMISGLEVNAENNGFKKPKSSTTIRISSAEGIQFDEDMRPGKHIFEVIFEDQAVYSHFLGHDVNLVKLEEHADVTELNAWMNWADPTAFISPAPEGFLFMGGIQDLPAFTDDPNSQVGFFEAHLKPGTYAFIAEVPDPMNKGMYKIFTVPTQSN